MAFNYFIDDNMILLAPHTTFLSTIYRCGGIGAERESAVGSPWFRAPERCLKKSRSGRGPMHPQKIDGASPAPFLLPRSYQGFPCLSSWDLEPSSKFRATFDRAWLAPSAAVADPMRSNGREHLIVEDLGWDRVTSRRNGKKDVDGLERALEADLPRMQLVFFRSLHDDSSNQVVRE